MTESGSVYTSVKYKFVAHRLRRQINGISCRFCSTAKRRTGSSTGDLTTTALRELLSGEITMSPVPGKVVRAKDDVLAALHQKLEI